MAHDVFVSYSVKDKAFADGLCATLEHKKIRCWVAPRDVLPGQNYAEALIAAVNTCRVMVLIFSSNSNDSQHMSDEVEKAVDKGIPIIPVRIENVVPTKTMENFLSSPHWLDAFTPPMEGQIEKLAETILTLLGNPNKPAEPPATQAASITKCAGCGKPMSSNLEYCINCGKKLADTGKTSAQMHSKTVSPQENQVSCTGCGKPMPISLEYCANCGKRLVKTPELARPSCPDKSERYII